MYKIWKYTVLTAAMVSVMFFAAGCGSKTTDPEATEVIKITITPEPTATPTPVPENSDAVVTNDGITMSNSYLLGESSSTTDTTTDTATDSTADTTTSEDDTTLDMQETDSEE